METRFMRVGVLTDERCVCLHYKPKFCAKMYYVRLRNTA